MTFWPVCSIEIRQTLRVTLRATMFGSLDAGTQQDIQSQPLPFLAPYAFTLHSWNLPRAGALHYWHSCRTEALPKYEL